MDNQVNEVLETTALESEVQTVESTDGSVKKTIVDVAIKTVAGVGLFIAGAISRPFIDKMAERRRAKKAEKELEKLEAQKEETEKKKK